MHILPVLLMALLGGQQVLDDFRYGDTAAARAVWTADEGSPPVEVVAEQDRPVMRLSAPFAAQPKLRRTVADRRVHLDLSAPGGFVLEAAIDDPALVGGLTLYFRSGSGWYSFGQAGREEGLADVAVRESFVHRRGHSCRLGQNRRHPAVGVAADRQGRRRHERPLPPARRGLA